MSRYYNIGEPSRRILWVDYAKSMAIFFVIWLHLHTDEEVCKLINAFVMPLFFIISGFLFSFERNPRFKPFALKRTRQIIVPYLWISALTYPLWLLEQIFTPDGDISIWYQPLIGTLFCLPGWLHHNVPLWSFTAFFIVEMAFYALRRAGMPAWLIFAGAMLLAPLLPQIFASGCRFIPFSLAPSVSGLGFYALGNMLARAGMGRGTLIRVISHPVTLAALLVGFCLGTDANSYVVFFKCEYGSNYLMYLLSSISGSLFIIGLSAFISSIIGLPKIVRFTSVSTLLICGFHLTGLLLIKFTALHFFGIDPSQVGAGACLGAAIALLCLLICLAPAWIINRYLPFLTDKSAIAARPLRRAR